VQALAAVDLRLGLLRRRLLEAAADLTPEVKAVQEIVAAVNAGLRDLLFELESADTSTPLPELLRDAAEQVLESSPIRWSLVVDTRRWNHASVLSQTDRGQALRTVKEVLLVLRQRARTGTVEVRVTPDGDGVEISVTHTGDGLEEHTAAIAPDAREVATMADRAELSGGWLRLQTEGGASTVRFWLPFDPAAPPYDGPRY
jgi:nitrate/nitrite-specific signal transduction histidine kinase